MRHNEVTFWIIAPDQNIRGIFDGCGKRSPDNVFNIPLKTIESNAPWDQTAERFESVRYFRTGSNRALPLCSPSRDAAITNMGISARSSVIASNLFQRVIERS